MKRSSVRLSVPPFDSSSGVRRVCCGAPRRQEISTDSRRRRSAANAGSVMLTAELTRLNTDTRCYYDDNRCTMAANAVADSATLALHSAFIDTVC